MSGVAFSVLEQNPGQVASSYQNWVLCGDNVIIETTSFLEKGTVSL